MNQDQLNHAAKLLEQDEQKFFEFIGDYCIENNVTADIALNSLAYGKGIVVPYRLDSAVETYIKAKAKA